MLRLEETQQLLNHARRFTCAEPGPEKDQAERDLKATVAEADRLLAQRVPRPSAEPASRASVAGPSTT